MKRFHHGFLFDSQNSTIRHGGCRVHAKRLACKRTLTEEFPLAYYPDGRFLAGLRDHGESYFALLDIKHRIGGISLRKTLSFFGKSTNFLPSPMVARNARGSNSSFFSALGSEGRGGASRAWRTTFLVPGDRLGLSNGDTGCLPLSATILTHQFYLGAAQ